MGSWFVSDVTQGIAGTLRKAAKATGAGFDYLVKTASRESNMDPAAKAKTSSAAGMFQFIEQTWFDMVKTAGPKYGLDSEAAAISRDANGRYFVADQKAKAKILALRHDPEVSALMAGEFTANNKALMTSALRRPPSEGELYAAHFLGPQGAIDLIRLASATPNVKAADHFPDAARANRSIFYTNGKARSAADVLAKVVNKHEKTPTAPVAPEQQEPSPLVAQGPASWFTNASPKSGPELAYADTKPVFHSLFQTGKRPPVSPYVQGIWSDLVPAGQAGQKAKTDGGKPLDLSTFLKPGIRGGA
jgi:hypothetical protein